MCNDTNCQHVKFNPNAKKTLGIADQAALWADIKDTRKALEDRVEFLREIGRPEHFLGIDPQMIKLEAMTRSLWERFRKL